MRIRPSNPEKTAWSAVVGAAALAMALLGFIAQPVQAQSEKGKAEQGKTKASKAQNTPTAPTNAAKHETKQPANAANDAASDTEKKVADPGKAASDSAQQGASDAKQTGRDADSSRKDAERDADRAKAARRDAARRADQAKESPEADRTPRDSALDKDRDRRDAARRDRSSKTADDRRDGDDRREKSSRAADDRGKSRGNVGLSFSDKSRERLTVSDVARNGLAGSAGFREGDEIVSFDGRRVNSEYDFNRWFLGTRARLPIVVIRDGRQTTLYSGYVADANPGNGAYLGVMFDARHPREVIIRQVNPNSPAEVAGLKNGSAILSINGQKIRSPEDLLNEIGNLSPGDEARLEIATGGRTDTVAVTLASRPGVSAQRYEVAKPPTDSADQRRTPAPAEDSSIDKGASAPGGPLRDRVRNNR